MEQLVCDFPIVLGQIPRRIHLKQGRVVRDNQMSYPLYIETVLLFLGTNRISDARSTLMRVTPTSTGMCNNELTSGLICIAFWKSTEYVESLAAQAGIRT